MTNEQLYVEAMLAYVTILGISKVVYHKMPHIEGLEVVKCATNKKENAKKQQLPISSL